MHTTFQHDITVFIIMFVFFIPWISFSSLLIHVINAKASKQMMEAFSMSLASPLKTLYFVILPPLFSVEDKWGKLSTVDKQRGVVARIVTTIPFLLIVIIHLGDRVNELEDESSVQIGNIAFWAGLYTVALIASWRFGRKIKDFENLQPEE